MQRPVPDPCAPADPARRVRLRVDGELLEAREGQSVAAALLASGRRALRRTGKRDEARGLFCGMGVCFDCLMQIDGRPGVQACLEPVTDGMRVETQVGAGEWRSRG